MLMRRPAEQFSHVGLYLGMAAVAAMACHVTVEVLSRLAFGRPLTGTIEIVSYFYMVAVTFLPLGNVQTRREHIVADAIANMLPKMIRPVTDFVGRLVSIAVGAFLLWGVTDMALRQTRIGEAVRAAYFDIPIWPARWMLTIGLGAMLLMMIVQLLSPQPSHSNDTHAGT